jgi:Mg2+ and Co2+ transporter CorA
VCNRLVRFDVALVPEDTRLYFRDVYDHVIRINETIWRWGYPLAVTVIVVACAALYRQFKRVGWL